MATRPKAIIESRNGEELSPITIAKNVLTDDGQNLHDILSDRKEDMMTPTIENSSSMFKVGQGDNVDYSENIVDGAYESLVFKGKSLVNLWKKHDTHNQRNFTLYEDGFMETVPNVLYFDHIQKANTEMIKPNTKYLLIVEVVKNTLPVPISFQSDNRTYFNGNSGMMFGARETGVVKKIITSISDLSTTRDDLRWGAYIQFAQDNVSESERGVVKIRQMLIEYQQGMENWDIPYFEGICDCKSPILSNVGKNLVNVDRYTLNCGSGAALNGYEKTVIAKNIKVKPNTTYTFSYGNSVNIPSEVRLKVMTLTDVVNEDIHVNMYSHKNRIKEYSVPNGGMFTTESHARYIAITTGNFTTIGDILIEDIQIEEGSATTPYEPYKSNILSCETYFDETTQSDKTIVLRSLPNGVCDTLNVETGEYVSYVEQVVLTGLESENWNLYHDESSVVNPRSFYITLAQGEIAGSNQRLFLNDKYPIMKSMTQECAWYFDTNGHKIAFTDINKRFADVSEWRNYLETNPITLFYVRVTPIVSTIDVQGFPYAYTNGHVQLSSGSIEQSLTPKVEYSVVTNRNGQIRSNQKMVERHQKQLDRLQAMILTNLVNTQYEQALTNLKYDLKNVREEVK